MDELKDGITSTYAKANVDEQYKSYSWYTAMGLQAVDGIKTSAYLEQVAEKNIQGKISFATSRELIETYYAKKTARTGDRTEEADKVAQRIAEMLAEDGFTLSSAQYLAIHERLFTGIYPYAGKLRDLNISKKEWVLNGESVIYGSATELQATLDYDLRAEKNYSYVHKSMDEIVEHLADFIANLWQIHPFMEGNTRTSAVFFIKYLNALGFKATNTTFAEHAWYFRNALVRANYNNLPQGICETKEYLVLFLRNLLLDEQNELRNRYLHVDYHMPKDSAEVSKPEELNKAVRGLTKGELGLYMLLNNEQHYTKEELGKKLGKSASTVQRLIKSLIAKKRLERIGSKKTGYWKVL